METMAGSCSHDGRRGSDGKDGQGGELYKEGEEKWIVVRLLCRVTGKRGKGNSGGGTGSEHRSIGKKGRRVH